jgi:hypothetical protein
MVPKWGQAWQLSKAQKKLSKSNEAKNCNEIAHFSLAYDRSFSVLRKF